MPNGANVNVATWDIGFGLAPNQAIRNMAVKWLDLDPAFNDLYGKYMTWIVSLATPTAFRCVWTNELR